MNIRVLQTSDWHLGAGVLPSGYGFDESIERLRRDEETAVLERISSIAKEREVDLVLLPGDLWDHESIAFPVARRVMEILGGLAPLPVVIVPGNHDFLGPKSPYDERMASQFGAKWPDNVHVVRSRSFEVFTFPVLPGVSFTAAATGANMPISRRLLATELPKGDGEIRILLFHGSQLDGRMSADGGLVTAPFTEDELLRQGFDYTALGHYHTYGSIADSDKRIRAAYSGAPFNRDFRSGKTEKGVLVFTLEQGGVSAESLELVPTDKRRYLKAEVRLSGVENDEAAEQVITAELQQVGCGPEDLVKVILRGAFANGEYWKPSFDPEDRAKAIVFDCSRLRPAFNLKRAVEDSAAGSAQGEFLRRMQRMIEEERGQPSPDERKLHILELAALVGYEAFSGNGPVLRTEPLRLPEDDSGEDADQPTGEQPEH